MLKPITAEELEAMRQKGAQVKREPREVFSPELEEAMRSVAKAVDDKRSTDVVNAIGQLTRAVALAKPEQIDINPVIEALNKHTEALKNRPTYVFNVTRNSKREMISVTATPQEVGSD